MRIVQLSDSHISHLGGVSAHNLERAVAATRRLEPDLVVHTGDLVIADPDLPDDRRAAQALLAPLGDRLRVVAGNHDVGEPGPEPWMGIPVTAERVAAFEAAWGAPWWVERAGGGAVIGLCSEIIGSGVEPERRQWAWLQGVARDLRGERVALFLHRPLRLPEGSAHHGVPPAAAARILDLLTGARSLVVGSGHLHRDLQAVRDGVLEVWAPATSFLVGAAVAPELPGEHRLGVVVHELGGDEPAARVVPLEDAEAMLFTDVPEWNASLAAMA